MILITIEISGGHFARRIVKRFAGPGRYRV